MNSKDTGGSIPSPFHFQHVIKNIATGECELFPSDDHPIPVGTRLTFSDGRVYEVVRSEYTPDWIDHIDDYMDPDWNPRDFDD